MVTSKPATSASKNNSIPGKVLNTLVKHRYIYLMALPVIAYYLIFHYWPMYGAMIAFKKFNPMKSFWEMEWVGFSHFIRFFSSYAFWRVTWNTFIINVYLVVFGFPAPIILALLLNEIRHNTFKRITQTISYIPHFVAVMVIAGIIVQFTQLNGIVNDIISYLGFERIPFLLKPEWFRTIYVSTSIWQEVGWGSIIYLAAISSIDPEQYSAATIDGAGKWKQLLHVTLPGIMPTIVILLILRIGQMMSLGFEKTLLLYNQSTYDTADIISTYVYRVGLLDGVYDYATAIGMFNSIINFILLFSANLISRKFNETSLW